MSAFGGKADMAIAPQNFASIWRIMVEVKTSLGPIVLKIPMFDGNVQEMAQACN